MGVSLQSPASDEELDLRRPHIPRAPTLPRLAGLGLEIPRSEIHPKPAAPPPLPSAEPPLLSLARGRERLEAELPSLPPLSPPTRSFARPLAWSAIGVFLLTSLLVALGSPM